MSKSPFNSTSAPNTPNELGGCGCMCHLGMGTNLTCIHCMPPYCYHTTHCWHRMTELESDEISQIRDRCCWCGVYQIQAEPTTHGRYR